MDFVIPRLSGYIIYDPKTGLFSRGGASVNWGKKPKIWSSSGALSSHLGQYINGNHDIVWNKPNGCYKGHEEIWYLYGEGEKAFHQHVKDKLKLVQKNRIINQIKYYNKLADHDRFSIECRIRYQNTVLDLSQKLSKIS